MRTLSLASDHADALGALAVCLRNQGKPGEARQALLEAVKRSSLSPSILVQAASIKLKNKSYEEARNLAREAQRNSRDSWTQATAAVIIASAYHAENDMMNAKEYYVFATTKWPECMPAQVGVAQCAIQAHQMQAAHQALSQVVRHYPGHPRCCMALASVCLELNETAEATKHLTAILEHRPV